MYERRVFNRKLLVLAHASVGFFSAVFYLNLIDLAGFPYWRSRSGLGVIFMAAPAIVPYAISGIYSWRVVTHRRLGVLLYLLVLVALSLLMGLLVSGKLGIDLHGIELLFTAAAQAGAYVWAADLLLNVDSEG